MVLTPIVKTASSAVPSGTSSGALLLSQFTMPSRRSEPKLQLESSPRSPWRLTRWPTSPVAIKRFSTPHTPVSPVQVVKQSFADDTEENQQEPEEDSPIIDTSALPSPSNQSHNNGFSAASSTSATHESTFSALWKRRVKTLKDDASELGATSIDGPTHTTTPTRKCAGGSIDLVDMRSSLASIRVHVKPVESLVSSDGVAHTLANEFGRDVTLMRTSLYEELEEFRQNPEEKVKMFPDYLSPKEKSLVKQVAESLRFGCQIGESNVSVFKTGPYEGHGFHAAAARMGRGRSVSESFLHDDVYVDVPSLVQHGKDGFIARLRLRRLDSGGGIRRNMLWDVAELASNDGVADRVSEGGGGVYAVQSRSSGEKLAMFKPAEEEKFVREGIVQGEGAVREEAAYLLDSRSNGFSGVPATAVARLHVANIGSSKHGSVQRFMMGSIGSMEGFGMPFDVAKAAAFVPVEQVHRIGLLDVRTFNTDRHPGNILLIGDKAPYTMAPIDHGCILPSWFHLSEARFDWLEYPQCKMPFSDLGLAYIDAIDAEGDAVVLRKLGIREECVTTMKICVLFMKIAAKAGRNLFWMGSFMQRSGCFENPSDLELAIEKACVATGIPFGFVPNEFGEQKTKITRGIISRRPPSLFFKHLERILTQQAARTDA
jgi:hypothetical protein